MANEEKEAAGKLKGVFGPTHGTAGSDSETVPIYTKGVESRSTTV